jgi:hypothetical protein
MTRKTYLARQRRERDRRAHAHGKQFVEFLGFRIQHWGDPQQWLASHVGQLVQRVVELEARVARLEGRKP